MNQWFGTKTANRAVFRIESVTNGGKCGSIRWISSRVGVGSSVG